MVGLDAAGKTTILYKLKLGEIVTTIPTIGKGGRVSPAGAAGEAGWGPLHGPHLACSPQASPYTSWASERVSV